MSRIERRTDYKHFPDAYTDLLLAYEREGEFRLGPMSLKEASNTRRNLYRFRGFLNAGYNQDKLAKQLADIARDAIFNIESEAGTDKAWIVVSMDPVTRAMKQQESERVATG